MSTVTPQAPVKPQAPAQLPRHRFRLRKDTRTAVVFLIPAGIGLVLFYLVPALRGLYYSFT
ncbi:MAG: hypothetical protein ACTHW1_05100 [Ancrocorticia sp.]|uniref:hypothetical protein n=1 Tax=Ancrocorticia sp. TaxID=2593684 RepID=UPI003F8E9171